MTAHHRAVGVDSPELPGLEKRPLLPAAADLSAEGRLHRAPIVIISTTAVTVRIADTTHDVASGPALDDPGVRKLYDTLVALRTAEPTLTGTLILQADRSTPAATVQRSLAVARAAGFDGVLFAVKAR